MTDWTPFDLDLDAQTRPREVTLPTGVVLRLGDHVVLRPARKADIFDLALAGKTATVVAIEQDLENRIHLVVTVDEDPGSDIGQAGKIGHRFFFGLEEIEPLAAPVGRERAP